MLWSFFKLVPGGRSHPDPLLLRLHRLGGPAGVGTAVGNAIRTSIVTIVVADFFLSFAIWGSTTTVRITG